MPAGYEPADRRSGRRPDCRFKSSPLPILVTRLRYNSKGAIPQLVHYGTRWSRFALAAELFYLGGDENGFLCLETANGLITVRTGGLRAAEQD